MEAERKVFCCKTCAHTVSYPASFAVAVECGCYKCGELYKINKAGDWELLNKRLPAMSKQDYWIELGTKGVLNGKNVELVGITQNKGAFLDSFWTEFLFVGEDGSRLYLAEVEGHWMLSEEFALRNGVHRHRLNSSFNDLEANEFYKIIYKYDQRILACCGFFEHQIHLGSSCHEYINKNSMIIHEVLDGRKRFYKAFHIDDKDLVAAFGESNIYLPYKKHVGPLQPFYYNINVFMFNTILICCALLLGLFYVSFNTIRQNSIVCDHAQVLEPDSVDRYAEITLKGFEVTGRRSNMYYTIVTDVDNNFAGYDVTLVNELTNEERNVVVEADYYYGVEGGESWTEGSRKGSARLCNVLPGKYHINLQPFSGGVTPINVRFTAVWDATGFANYLLALFLLGVALLIMNIAKGVPRVCPPNCFVK